jgi:hypothetical protein
MIAWILSRLTKLSTSKPAESGDAPPRKPTLDALHVFVLVSFAVAQPLFDRLGANAVFLIHENIKPGAVFLVVLLVLMVLPAAIVCVEWVAARYQRRAYDSVHVLVIFCLLVLLVLPPLKLIGSLPGVFLLGAALAAGALGTWLYFESRSARAVVTASAFGIVVFPALFGFHSSATKVLFPRGAQPLAVTAKNPVPVVVVVFDEFCGLSLLTPERRIDVERFPNFARLAQGSTWFRNATGVHTDTEQALPAMLSGLYPTSGAVPVHAHRPQNLFSVLESTGNYNLAAFEPVSNLAPRNRERDGLISTSFFQQTTTLIDALSRVYLYHITPVEYSRELPRLPKSWFGVAEGNRIDSASRRGVFRYSWGAQRDEQLEHFLACLDGSSQPALHFLHVLLPHIPWCYLPSGRAYSKDDKWEFTMFDPNTRVNEYWGSDELVVSQGQQRYLLQLGYLDRFIGQLTERLRETRMYDRCLLIVAADHGVAFRADGPRRATSPENVAEIISVPLFIKRPNQTIGQVNDRHVETIDILPTIVDVLGIRLPSPVDGWSAFDESHPDRTHKVIYDQQFKELKVDPAVVIRSDAPRVIEQRFGKSSDPAALFRSGPIPEMVGRPIDSFAQSDGVRVEIELTQFGDQLDAALDSLVPCYFEGTVSSPKELDQPVTLAVAVNGTIHAVTRTYWFVGRCDHWAAIIPESSLQLGKNDIQFYSVTVHGSGWRIAPCTVSPQARKK